MKTIIAILILLTSLPAISQVKRRDNNTNLSKLKTELNLTQDQESQIRTVLTSHRSRVKLQAPVNNTEERLKQKMQLRKDLRTQVAKILTPEQRKAYIELLNKNQTKKK